MEANDTVRYAKTSLKSFDVAQGTDDVASKWDSYGFKHALAKVIVDLLQDKCNEESLAFLRSTAFNTWGESSDRAASCRDRICKLRCSEALIRTS